MDGLAREDGKSFHSLQGDSVGVVVVGTLLDLVHRVQEGDRVDHRSREVRMVSS